jgi:two-component system, NarL family, nitrate/nitrite response regulator NarL
MANVACKLGESELAPTMTHFPVARILIVDDFPSWREQVREILAAHPEWEIVSEASDGQEAVQQARELQPDVVVLDIGLPRFNGIEAAKMIRQESPNSRIVFLTLQNDPDIMRPALRVGQTTYVPKAKANTLLCDALAASLRGI